MANIALRRALWAEEAKKPVTRLSLVTHLLGSLWYGFIVYEDLTHRHIPIFNRYGGRTQFLTLWSMYLTFAASCLALCTDATYLVYQRFGLLQERDSSNWRSCMLLVSIRDHIMTTFICPLLVFVSIMYWSVCAVDFHGIHPPEVERISPLFGWYNNAVHTCPLVYAFVLIMNVKYQFNTAKCVNFEQMVFIFAYVAWMKHCAENNNGTWAYHFLMKLSNGEFGGFLLVCHIMILVIFLFQRKIREFYSKLDELKAKKE